MFSYALPPDAELRLLERHHAEALYAVCDRNRDRLREYLPWIDGTLSADDTRSFVERALQQFADGKGFHAGIWHNGNLAGCIGLHPIDAVNQAVALGYWLDKEHEGCGLMTRAAEAITNYCFREVGLHRVEIRCAVHNLRSQRVAERLGFVREGVLRHAQKVRQHWLDMVVFSKLSA